MADAAVKKPNILVKAGNTVSRFFKDVKGEAKKIIWPTFPSVVRNTLVVIGMVVLVGACIWVLDWIIWNIYHLLLGEGFDPFGLFK